ncbi:MAG: NAD(P)/FAD-dependent oxidoreductase [Clostridia bacterium]|nr:NAD(P)/FAD-dependent oxidoreductase [Clostridia bacterium]
MSERFDVAIIGTGPAGLSAAITLKIRKKNILLIGSHELSYKLSKAHEIQNYLGLPSITGEALAEHFREHLRKMEIEITEDKVTAVYAMGDYFALWASNNQIYEADSVILATGVNFGKPYPKEEHYLGRGVSYCATCDGALYRGKKVIVIGYAKKDEAEAEFLSELAEHVSYIPMYQEPVTLSEQIEIIEDKPISIDGSEKVEKLITQKGEYEADGIFILRESVAPSQLVPGISVSDGHVVVNRKMETNLQGCFACGDIVGTPYQYIKSAGEGNIAALSAAGYLDQKKRQMTAK